MLTPASSSDRQPRYIPDPISPTRLPYHTLLRIFSSSDRDGKLRARVLPQISGALTNKQMGIVASLDPILLHPGFVTRISSRSLYVEYLLPDPGTGLIIELRRTTSGRLLEQMHGRRNRRVRLSVALAARERLRALGIVLLHHAPGDWADIAAVGKVMDIWEFGSEDIGGGFAVNDAAFITPQTAEDVLAGLTETAE